MSARRQPAARLRPALLLASALACAGAGAVVERTIQMHLAAAESAAIAPGSVDIGFSQAMSQHHDQAVVMSQLVLARGAGEVRLLAQSILMGQLVELGEMRGWLAIWKHSLVAQDASMNWMLTPETRTNPEVLKYVQSCRSSPGGMPGLATMDELNRLQQLQGRELEQEYLRLMIRHHQGALPMARFASLFAETPAVRAFAGQIAIDQGNEIGRMTQMLMAHPSGASN